MRQWCAGLLAAVALAAPAAADEPAAKGLTGTWVKESDGIELALQFLPAKLTITVTAGDNGAVITCKATQKDGVVKATVTASEEKGTFPGKPPVGMAFEFTFKPDGKTAKLTDYKGGMAEEGKAFVEGEYKKKDEK